MASLSDIFKMQIGGFPSTQYGSMQSPNKSYGIFGPPAMNTAHTTPMTSVDRTLPNGGGMFSSPVVAPPVPTTSVFPSKDASGVTTTPPPPQIPSEWIKPGGGIYSAKEVVDNMAMKKQGGGTGADIPKYAGDVLTQGPQTTEQLQGTAAGLNNARNDIATGETDPYKVGNQSGIPYTFDELNAIQKAYAGVYDPAINSALAKLDAKQKQEAQVFATDENIRQYKATTAANKASSATAPIGLARGTDGYVDPYAYVNKAKAFEAQGGSMKKFLNDYPPENYVNPISLNNPEVVPSFMKQQMTASGAKNQTDIANEGLYFAEIAKPENADATDVEKAAFLRSLNLDPTDQKYGLYGV